ncbi:hypothetical protein [Aeromonas hydrophila]|uniref:hypothetical protein n=1 Tax=Aeromonas hydrophila TaxID=644 RepID=UPI002B45A39C|nr:hypothetical protein [Aeromonas hydrophila]
MSWVINPLVKDISAKDGKEVLKQHLQNLRKQQYAFHIWYGGQLFSSKNSGYCFPVAVLSAFRKRISSDPSIEINKDFLLFIKYGHEVYFINVINNNLVSCGIVSMLTSVERELLLASMSPLLKIWFINGDLQGEISSLIADRQLYGVKIDVGPIEEIKSFKFKSTKEIESPYAKAIKLAFVSVTALGVCFWFYNDWRIQKEEERRIAEEAIKDPMKGAREAMTIKNSNAKIFFAQLMNDMTQFDAQNGFDVVKVSATESKLGNDYTMSANFELIQSEGKYSDIKPWAGDNGFMTAFINNKIQLTKAYVKMPVLYEAVLPPIDGLTLYVSDAVKAWWDNVQVTSEVSVSDKWVERVINVTVSGWTPQDFDTLGSLINGNPIAIQTIDLSKNDMGYSGKISFIAYGSSRDGTKR